VQLVTVPDAADAGAAAFGIESYESRPSGYVAVSRRLAVTTETQTRQETGEGLTKSVAKSEVKKQFNNKTKFLGNT
jgi:hypothetical protein